jgi:predicted Rossmann-fold nucleotide-binding protein
LGPNAQGKKVKICVYCGSAPGKDPAHIEAARELGKLMAENDIELGKLGNHFGL